MGLQRGVRPMVFERMVRWTKRCLHKMIGRASLTQDEILTAVIEIEGVTNSRPLSYLCSSDLDEPLTHFHLSVGRTCLTTWILCRVLMVKILR